MRIEVESQNEIDTRALYLLMQEDSSLVTGVERARNTSELAEKVSKLPTGFSFWGKKKEAAIQGVQEVLVDLSEVASDLFDFAQKSSANVQVLAKCLVIVLKFLSDDKAALLALQQDTVEVLKNSNITSEEREAILELQRKLKSKLEDLEKTRKEFENLKLLCQKSEDEIKGLHAKCNSFSVEIEDLKKKEKENLNEHRQQLEDFSQKHARLSDEVRENKVKHNNERLEIKRSVENLKELLDKLKGKSQTLSSDLVELDDKVAKLEVQREKAVKQSLEFEEQIQQLSAQNQRLEAELQAMADEKDKASFFSLPNVASISALLLVVLHFILNLCGVV